MKYSGINWSELSEKWGIKYSCVTYSRRSVQPRLRCGIANTVREESVSATHSQVHDDVELKVKCILWFRSEHEISSLLGGRIRTKERSTRSARTGEILNRS